MANAELEEDSSIESGESAEAIPIESEVVNSSISSDDTINYARDYFSYLDDEPVNADLECDEPQDSFSDLECNEPMKAAVDDGLCSSSPVHAWGFSLIFILLTLLMAVYCHKLKSISRKYPHYLIWCHIC